MSHFSQPKIHRASKYPAEIVEKHPKSSENANTSTRLFSIYCNIVDSCLFLGNSGLKESAQDNGSGPSFKSVGNSQHRE
jgi:hypothetical protein